MQNIYSVAYVNAYIKNMFSQDFLLKSLQVKGEASNVKYHTSGHIYFTLKDEKASVACVMFASSRSGLRFKLENGQQIVVTGTVDVYERDGKFQIYARSIESLGIGYLYEQYEKLKADLEEMGLFAGEYKKPIPKYAKCIGIVTAKTGAAIQDIIQVARRRNPYVQLVLYPAIVQGDAASKSIIMGIRTLERAGVDLIIVGRGGGSIEDLWAFNEQSVAEAIFNCETPIISAVGHEIDFTIADFVADMRAPTPSAAAELAVFEVENLQKRIQYYESLFKNTMVKKISSKRTVLNGYKLRMERKHPMNQMREKRMYLLNIEDRMQYAMKQKMSQKKHRLQIYIEKLEGLSPLNKLKQGYSYTESQSGSRVCSVNEVIVGDNITVHVQDGKILAKVTDTKQKGNG